MSVLDFEFEKQPWEETTRAVNASGWSELQAGETIESAEVIVYLGTQPHPDMLVSSAIDGGRVLFRVRGGTDGLAYKITVRAITDQGHRREADGMMYVREK